MPLHYRRSGKQGLNIIDTSPFSKYCINEFFHLFFGNGPKLSQQLQIKIPKEFKWISSVIFRQNKKEEI